MKANHFYKPHPDLAAHVVSFDITMLRCGAYGWGAVVVGDTDPDWAAWDDLIVECDDTDPDGVELRPEREICWERSDDEPSGFSSHVNDGVLV